jgi:hypothetical protein
MTVKQANRLLATCQGLRLVKYLTIIRNRANAVQDIAGEPEARYAAEAISAAAEDLQAAWNLLQSTLAKRASVPAPWISVCWLPEEVEGADIPALVQHVWPAPYWDAVWDALYQIRDAEAHAPDQALEALAVFRLACAKFLAVAGRQSFRLWERV